VVAAAVLTLTYLQALVVVLAEVAEIVVLLEDLVLHKEMLAVQALEVHLLALVVVQAVAVVQVLIIITICIMEAMGVLVLLTQLLVLQ
jgi:hypothetical protein